MPGRELATEFYWRTPPTPQAREVFLGQVCPGMHFDTVEDWMWIYASAGLTGLETMSRVAGRPAYTRKMAWLMPRMAKAVPCLGYVIIAGTKPA